MQKSNQDVTHRHQYYEPQTLYTIPLWLVQKDALVEECVEVKYSHAAILPS